MSISIAFLNEKGGVTKTTSAYNTAYALAANGKRVLMIDFDSQASLTVAVGLELEEVIDVNLGLVLTGESTLEDTILTITCHNEVNIDIIPSHNSVANIVQEFSANPNKKPALHEIMAKILTAVSELYDYIIIDCPPTVGIMLVTALMVSDGVIVPLLSGDYLSLVGVENTLTDLEEIHKIRQKPEFLGVIVSRHKKNLKNHIEMLQHVQDNYCILGVVNETDAFATSLGEGIPVKLLRPATIPSRLAAQAYDKVATGIINHYEYQNGRSKQKKPTQKKKPVIQTKAKKKCEV